VPLPPALGPLGPAPHTPSSEQSRRTVTVVRGDSLWSIAARHLGPHATDQQVAREWPRWYAVNRRVIGSDPDLIRVGQVLTAPGTGAGS
jgi:nucleoid-associated protein YgaU